MRERRLQFESVFQWKGFTENLSQNIFFIHSYPLCWQVAMLLSLKHVDQATSPILSKIAFPYSIYEVQTIWVLKSRFNAATLTNFPAVRKLFWFIKGASALSATVTLTRPLFKVTLSSLRLLTHGILWKEGLILSEMFSNRKMINPNTTRGVSANPPRVFPQ